MLCYIIHLACGLILHVYLALMLDLSRLYRVFIIQIGIVLFVLEREIYPVT